MTKPEWGAQGTAKSEWNLRKFLFVSITIVSLLVLTVYRLGTFPPVLGFWESYTYYYTVASKSSFSQPEGISSVINVTRAPGYDTNELVRDIANTIGTWASYRNAMPRQPNVVGGETSEVLYRLARFSFKYVGLDFIGLRIIPALSIALFVLFFYLFVKNLLGDDISQYSTLALLTFPALFVYGRQYTIMAPSLLSLSFLSWALTIVEKRPTLLRLILFGIALSWMPYFYFFSRLITVAILAYFCIFKFKMPVYQNSFVNRLSIIKLNPQFAVILVVFVGMLTLYSPLNLLFLFSGEFLFPLRVEYATSLAQMAGGLLANVRFLMLALTVGLNDALPIHLMNSAQNTLIIPVLSPILFFGIVSHIDGKLVRNLKCLGDLKYVYLILFIGTFPALLSLPTATTGTTMSIFRISYAIVPLAIFVGLGLVCIGNKLRQYVGHDRSRFIIFSFIGMCSICSTGSNLNQFDYFDSFLKNKIVGRSISREFSPVVRSYDGESAYYHESYSEQVYYDNLARSISGVLLKRGDNIILYLDRDKYIPKTANTHFWCVDYLKPFLGFYLAREQFNIQYIEWYDRSKTFIPVSSISNPWSYPIECSKSSNRGYEIKSYNNSHTRTIFLATTTEDLEVARNLSEDREVVVYSGPTME